jgi:hypothetical protein
MADDSKFQSKDPLDAAQGQFNRAIRLAETRPKPLRYFRLFPKQPHEISADKMREALLGGYKAKLEQLPKEIRDKAMDYIDRREINFSTVQDVKNVLDAAIKLALASAESIKQALQAWEINQYGSASQRRSCGKCGVKDGPGSPLQLPLDHLQPIDVKAYCPKCFIAAHNAAESEHKAALSSHATEEQRRSMPDDEL